MECQNHKWERIAIYDDGGLFRCVICKKEKLVKLIIAPKN